MLDRIRSSLSLLFHKKIKRLNPILFLSNILITFLFLAVLTKLISVTLNWFFFEANFSAESAYECRKSPGACWAFIIEKHRFILFGSYPYTEQWRPCIASLILIFMIASSGFRYFWNWLLPFIWSMGLILVFCLMWGGIFGLKYVDNTHWGGLPLTLILSTVGIIFAFPIGMLLALGRCSKMPTIEFLSVLYIELIRGVPLISILFISSIVFPLFLPEGLYFDKLLRAQIAIIIFSAAYIAEIIRGGLQAIPIGQYEGACSLGLNYWQKMFKVILPQAIRMVVSPLISIIISVFKDTSLVVVIGIFDLTLTAKSVLSDAEWYGFGMEVYIFVASIYFLFCYLISRFGRTLERYLRVK